MEEDDEGCFVRFQGNHNVMKGGCESPGEYPLGHLHSHLYSVTTTEPTIVGPSRNED